MTSSTPPPRRISRRQQLLIVACLAGAALGVAGIASLASFTKPKTAAAAPTESGVLRPTADQWRTLTLEPASLRDFDLLQVADGRIEADGDRTTQVTSPFTGRVLQVFAEPGQKVDRRTPLFSAEASEVAQARADLSSALAAQATAEAQLKLARETETRQEALYRNAGGALKDWRQAQSDTVSAEGQLRSAAAALGSARGRLASMGLSDKDVAGFERAPADRAQDGKATVYAPAAGVVTRRALGPGQTLSPGGDPLFSISDLSTVWLTAQVRESDAAKVRLGAKVTVTTPAWPGRAFTAKVVYVAPTLDPDTRRLPVRAELANADGALKPEMFARFGINSGSAGRSVGVPESAVIRDGDTARVWVATADGLLRIRPVQVGVTEDGMVQITQGLQPGEKVVTKGALFVDQAGQPD